MSNKIIMISIPEQVSSDFERAARHTYKSDEEIQLLRVFVMAKALADYTRLVEESYPYQTIQVDEGKWNIFYCEDGKEPRLADGHPQPFAEKPNADRKRKAMNRKWHKAAKETEANMAANGGAIII